MRFCWWIVTFEYCGKRDGGFGWPVYVAQHSVFTTDAQKAIDATSILLGFSCVLACSETPAPLNSLLINYYPGRDNF